MWSWRHFAIASALAVVSVVQAQTAPMPQNRVEYDVSSGEVVNEGRARDVIWSTLLHQPGASWIRLEFAGTRLGRRPSGGDRTLLRVSSLLDGATQNLNSHHVGQWRETSAYFNGDCVLVELVADPGAEPSRVSIVGAWCGEPVSGGGDPSQTICGANDDRLPSAVPRAGRVVPTKLDSTKTSTLTLPSKCVSRKDNIHILWNDTEEMKIFKRAKTDIFHD